MSQHEIIVTDPSQLYRPDAKWEKVTVEKDTFRNFTKTSALYERVFGTYLKMHTNQCVEFVRNKHKQWLKFDHAEMTVMEALELLDKLIDESDPDADFPNSYHAFQTAEGIRRKFPDLDWFHLTGLIHDLGKVMAIWGEEQYATVGDTFIVGCEFPQSIVHRDTTFHNNPDLNEPRYNTKYGMYQPNCGMSNLLTSWGHDEYMYHVLLHNKCKLPQEALYCVRFHSLYPWHHGNDYCQFMDENDKELIKWVNEFNEHDLYTKLPDIPDIDEIKPYYQSLIEKYMPGKLKW